MALLDVWTNHEEHDPARPLRGIAVLGESVMDAIIHVAVVTRDDEGGLVAVVRVGLNRVPQLEEHRVVVLDGAFVVFPVTAVGGVIGGPEVGQDDPGTVALHHLGDLVEHVVVILIRRLAQPVHETGLIAVLVGGEGRFRVVGVRTLPEDHPRLVLLQADLVGHVVNDRRRRLKSAPVALVLPRARHDVRVAGHRDRDAVVEEVGVVGALWAQIVP